MRDPASGGNASILTALPLFKSKFRWTSAFFECRTTRPVAETMARSTSLALILSAILGIANAQVAVLDGDTFDATVVNGGKNAIVKFYAPWYDRTRGSGISDRSSRTRALSKTNVARLS